MAKTSTSTSRRNFRSKGKHKSTNHQRASSSEPLQITQKSHIAATHNWAHTTLFWFSILIAVFGNLIIAIALLPVLFALNGPLLYTTNIVLGLSFGFLFELLVRSMLHIERKHHAVILALVPCLALLGFVAIGTFANQLEQALGLRNAHSPLRIALVYSVSFLIPYMGYFVIKNHDAKNE